MKKIVCVLRTLGSGGAQKALTFVANSLAEDKNMQVTLIALYKSEFSLTVSPNVQVITGDLKIDAYRDMSGWQRKTAQLKNLFWLRKQLKTVKPDLMCVFLADLVFFCTMAKLFMRIPLIASERGTPQKFSRFQEDLGVGIRLHIVGGFGQVPAGALVTGVGLDVQLAILHI